MGIRTFKIEEHYIFETETNLPGHFEGDPTPRQIIVNQGNETDLSMKKGEPGRDLQITVPPLTSAMFHALVATYPRECRCDLGGDPQDPPSKFEIDHVYGNETRTVKVTFCVT